MEFSENKSITEVLKSGDLELINNAIQNSQFQQHIIDNSNNLIATICNYLSEDLWRTNRDLFSCYKNVLNIISEKSNTNIIISLLEEIEVSNVFYEKFIAIVTCMSNLLHRLGGERGYFLQFSFELIANYVNDLRPPNDTYECGEEIRLVLNDRNTKVIIYIYEHVLKFSNSFIGKFTSSAEPDAILSFYFRLLGKPFIFVNLEHNDSLYTISQNMLKFICSRINDVTNLLEHLDEKTDLNDIPMTTENSTVDVDLREKCEEISLIAENVRDYKSKITLDSLAGFFYLFFCHNDDHYYISYIYDRIYIVNRILYLCVELLSVKNEIAINKGLRLSSKVLDEVQSGQMTRSCLQEVHLQFISNLSAIGIYSNIQDHRTRAAKLLSQYIHKFDLQSKYLLFFKMAHLSGNSVFDGYTATLFKEEIDYQLNKEELDDYFSGKRFADLVFHFCSFKDGTKTDVVEKSAEIICVLNLLLFIYVRDKSNLTKIWDYVNIFMNKYYIEFKEAINHSEHNYKLRLHAFEEAQGKQNNYESKLNVTVGGKSLKPLSHDDKIDSIKKDITSIDMVKYVLERVHDAIASKNL